MKFFIALTLLSLLAVSSAQQQFIQQEELPNPYELIHQLDEVVPAYKILKTDLFVNKDDECHKCIDKGTLHILNATWNHIEKKCANATGKYEKLHCDWFKSHVNETWGYLSVELRPAAVAWGYCVGKGKCKHGNKTDITPDPNSDSPVVYNAAIPVFKKLVTEISDDDIEREERRWNRLPEKIEKKFNKLSEEEIEEVNDDEDDEANGGLLCKLCLHVTTKHVLKGKIKKVIKACEKTTCPVLKKWCAWANNHREFVRGQIYAHVQPYKYAIGYCLGAKVCPHPPPSSWDYYIYKKEE